MDSSKGSVAHPDYDANALRWERLRTVLEGEDAVKASGESLLPMLTGQELGEYKAFVKRTSFFNATGRTKSGLLGMLFRKEPVIKVDKVATEKEAADFLADVDLAGNSAAAYAKNLCDEVLSVGRGGTLVDYSVEEKRASLLFYKAEDIWNWRVQRLMGRVRLSMVALHECVVVVPSLEGQAGGQDGEIPALVETVVEKLKVLKLVPGTSGFVYQVDTYVWNSDKEKPGWKFESNVTPMRRGTPLDFIPFEFHGAEADAVCCAKPPLEDILQVNLHHYRVSADYNHALHYTALPTAWVAGFKADTQFKIGSSVAWVSEKSDAKAGYLEFQGHGLGALEKALEADEMRMSILGARLLEQQKRDAEAAETVKLRQGGESSVLSDISASASKTMTRALKTAFWWMGTMATPDDITDEMVNCEINRDFMAVKMDAPQLTALLNTLIRGAISTQSFVWNLKQGEFLPPGRTIEQEIELIGEDTAALGKPDDGRGKDEDKEETP